jgi:RNA polymerase sigma-70 factor (ECF subfamily)
LTRGRLADRIHYNVSAPSDPAAWLPEEPASFETFFREFFPRLTGYFRAKGFSQHDAEDLSQNTLWNVYRSREDFRGEGSFDAWIYVAARNAAYDEWRRRGRTPRAEANLGSFADERPTADVVAEGRQDLSRASQALRNLPARMRACLLLQVQQGLSYKEIAERLSLSARTVKVQIWNARRRLKTLLGGT